jgi:hypothetical protein
MQADEAWPAVVEAFAHYGKKVVPKLRSERRKLVEQLLVEFEPEELVAAVHGYVRYHEGLDQKDDFNPRKFFNPESVFRLGKMEQRVELGLEGPWSRPLTHEEQVKARQEAARERVARAREAMEAKRLRAL